jgi:hypothetical protein
MWLYKNQTLYQTIEAIHAIFFDRTPWNHQVHDDQHMETIIAYRELQSFLSGRGAVVGLEINDENVLLGAYCPQHQMAIIYKFDGKSGSMLVDTGTRDTSEIPRLRTVLGNNFVNVDCAGDFTLSRLLSRL